MSADPADFLTPEETARLQQDLASLSISSWRCRRQVRSRTREAWTEFQTRNKLPADGIYGRDQASHRRSAAAAG